MTPPTPHPPRNAVRTIPRPHHTHRKPPSKEDPAHTTPTHRHPPSPPNPHPPTPTLYPPPTQPRLPPPHQVDTEPYSQRRDAQVDNLAAELSIDVMTRVGHTLTHLSHLLKSSSSKPLTVMAQFLTRLNAELAVNPIVSHDRPSALPAPTAAAKWLTAASAVPSLADLGREDCAANGGQCSFAGRPVPVLRGGETAALARMHEMLARTEWVASFEKPKTSPTDFDPRSTTGLSPYLKFGCLSVRTLHIGIETVYASVPEHSQPPSSLLAQLYWREFFHAAAYGTGPNYGQMKDNPICKQIGWDANPEYVEAWRNGRTGYPWIDAAMTQLRVEGWIHHLARHAVACFLTRGDLFQSWMEGAKVFSEYLVDADWELNNGNWMWLSCSCFFYQYFRCYSPVAFPKKFDKDGEYIRRWIPQLRHFSKKYIFTPWEAPVFEQREAGCEIGTECYPLPIVEHEVVSKENMQRITEAYDADKALKKKKRPPPKKPPKSRARRALSALADDGRHRERAYGTCAAEDFSAVGTADMDSGSMDEWQEQWRERIEEWWLMTPYQQQLGACMGALSLHLGSRWSAILTALQRSLGANAIAAPPPVAAAAESGCEWVAEAAKQGTLQLPDFPELPSAIDVLPPLPRLLPQWTTPEWELTRNVPSGGAGLVAALDAPRDFQQAPNAERHTLALFAPGLAGGAAAAVAMGAALGLARIWRRSRGSRCALQCSR